MGGQAKSKKGSKARRKPRGTAHDLSGLSAEERMKARMQNRAKKKTAGKYSVHQLLEKTEEYLDNFNYEMAQLFCQRALDIEPDNLEILDMMGNICMELGDADKAKQAYLRAVELSPDEGHAKYMCLGQIHCKEEALKYFQKGTDIMIHTLQKQSQASGAAGWPEEMEVTAKDIAAAFCSVAEIYLTDLCMEEGAGGKCIEAIEKALEYSPDSPEALQLKASYLFSMEQQREGKEFLLRSLASWLPSMQKSGSAVPEQGACQLEASEVVFPPYESRITTAKLLIEAEEFQLATEILEALLEEDDEVVQVWYLLGWVCYLQAKAPNDEEDEEAAALKDSARIHLRKAKKLYGKLHCDDAPLLEHVEQLLAELGGADAPEDSDAEDAPLENVDDDFVQSSDEEAMES